MLSRTKRTEILAMHEKGHSRTTISQELALSMMTVARVIGAHEKRPSPYTVAAHRRRDGKAAALAKADGWLGSK